MINDLGELQSPQEQRSPGGYVHILQEGDRVKTSSEGRIEIVELPKKNIGSMGNTWIYLSKPTTPPDDDHTGLYLSDRGVNKISSKEAFKQGFYNLNIRIENPLSRLSAEQYFVHLSIQRT